MLTSLLGGCVLVLVEKVVSSNTNTNTQVILDKNISELGNKILIGISKQEMSFEFKYASKGDAMSDIDKEIDMLKITHPIETYNISNYVVTYSDTDVKMECTYKANTEQMIELDEKVQEIVSKLVKRSMSETDKETVMHDWIVNNTKYDKTYTIYDPYNTLIKHTGVCEGYTLLIQKMLETAGLKSIVVEGTAEGVSHSWNLVLIDNKYKHLDVTWDDPVTSNNTDRLSFKYFNLTDRQIEKDHSWDRTKYPKAE